MALADLKRKFPSFADKTDEDLLVDKERPVKRPEPSYVSDFLQQFDWFLMGL
jgi:hypothetical protein